MSVHPWWASRLFSLLLLLLLSILATTTTTAETTTKKDASDYCYDGCSNHGTCVKNACVCEPGWYGENCATAFGLAPLSVGDFNLTSWTQLKQLFNKHEALLIGISSGQCAKCGLAETEYAQMDRAGIPFIRVEAAENVEILTALGIDPATPLPTLVFTWNYGKKRGLYRGSHSAQALGRFLKLKGSNRAGWTEWNQDERPPELGLKVEPTDVIALGFFPAGEDEDTDEFDEFRLTASELRSRHDIHSFHVRIPRANKKSTKKKSSSSSSSAPLRPVWYPPINIALPALGVVPALAVNDSSEWKFITLTEPVAAWSPSNPRPSFADWISLNAIPLAVKLVPETFAAMEELGLPMLLVFSPSTDVMDLFLPSLRDAAKEFRGRITVMYDADGVFQDKMHVLGLTQPHKLSMAMNTREVGPVPFLGSTITNSSFREFCADYLAGRTIPLSKLNEKPHVGSMEEDKDDQIGVREGFYASDVGIVDVSDATAWTTSALDESLDVVVFVYRSKGCLPCRQLAPFYKKMARRLVDLKRTTTKSHHVVCVRVDLDRFRPEGLADVSVPAIIMLPAFNKRPPFRFFSAIAKVFTMMEWARKNAGRPFDWGEELPQFDAEEKRLFKEQIQTREESKAKATSAEKKQEL